MSTIKKIIMVRHGETKWNTENRIQGQANTPLTELGIKQAQQTGKALHKENISEIYSSDLGRAMQTAKVINKYLNLSIIKQEGLRERNYGVLQGISFDELDDKFPVIRLNMNSRDPNYVIPGGESIFQFSQRVSTCINSIIANSNASNLLLVVHGGVLERFFHTVVGLPLDFKRSFSLSNSSINKFSYVNGMWQLDSWGITNHLNEALVLNLKY